GVFTIFPIERFAEVDEVALRLVRRPGHGFAADEHRGVRPGLHARLAIEGVVVHLLGARFTEHPDRREDKPVADEPFGVRGEGVLRARGRHERGQDGDDEKRCSHGMSSGSGAGCGDAATSCTGRPRHQEARTAPDTFMTVAKTVAARAAGALCRTVMARPAAMPAFCMPTSIDTVRASASGSPTPRAPQ